MVDGLEDVKAHDIKVFDTEAMSPLFERVIVASGSSNRQTKALATSVLDAVREAGFPKPRVEGEANGEWIIVDCGLAVVHIMQPYFRSYYNLEELWGDKPVRLKLGAARPAFTAPTRSAATTTPSKPAKALRQPPARQSGAGQATPAKARPKKAQSAQARQPGHGAGSARSKAPRVKTLVVNAPGKPAGKRAAAAKSAAKKPARKA